MKRSREPRRIKYFVAQWPLLSLGVYRVALVAFAGILATATGADQLAHAPDGSPDFQGADIGSREAYSLPIAGLHESAVQKFAAGRAEFSARWVAPFASGGHWGRGPQSNAESCAECHPGNGRGRAPDGPDEAPHSMVMRLALPGPGAATRPLPHPAYGTQLNSHGTLGKLVEEGAFRVDYETRAVMLADGSFVELRNPVVHITALWYGPLGDGVIISPRIAQPVFGLGLLEAVPHSTLHGIARDQQRIGFNGRLNFVSDKVTGRMLVGRFGHKAVQPNLLQQVAAAFHEEIGVTSRLFPSDECWPIQKACYRVESVSAVEAQDIQLDVIADYLAMLAPPPQRNADNPEIMRGAAIFERAKCAVCHFPALEISPDMLYVDIQSRQIRPYTDLLLHDMGEGLADGRREFLAGGQDWRTAPLWGLGLRKAVNGNGNLLHDGRARSVSEAILWHGGEAEVSRLAFVTMEPHERRALLRFLDSL